MLPKKHRLLDDYDFRQVRRRGNQFNSPFFSLFVFREAKSQPTRFGFVVSSRVDKRAVKRNRIKRIFRDEVTKLLPRVRPGVSAAFWVRGASLVAEPEKIRASIREALQKAGIIQLGY